MDHHCTDRCVCPDLGTLMMWRGDPSGQEHACVDPECRYASGLESKLYDEYTERLVDRQYEPWLDDGKAWSAAGRRNGKASRETAGSVEDPAAWLP
jgi:hypothetical protein